MFHTLLKKTKCGIAAVLIAKALAVLLIHLFSLIGFVTVSLSVIKRHNSSLDFVLVGVVGMPQMLSDAVEPTTCPSIVFESRSVLRKKGVDLYDAQ